jgi:hypothetical protein
MSLPECVGLSIKLAYEVRLISFLRRVVGAPNFRRLPLILPELETTVVEQVDSHQMVCGSGMPTIEG